jgi:hypothetical protein
MSSSPEAPPDVYNALFYFVFFAIEVADAAFEIRKHVALIFKYFANHVEFVAYVFCFGQEISFGADV